MRIETATYTDLDGKPFTVEYDADAPCIECGQPVISASQGGTVVCPWCDMGRDRRTGKMVFRMRECR